MTGRHLLGPHVVGQRVVVRRILPGQTGPSGGPAMTDLLGVCERWSARSMTVRPEHGDPVDIALADIVSGKPVPPRPSVRARVSACDAERHTLVLWPELESHDLGEWVLRREPAGSRELAERGRPLKRANSCLALGDPAIPVTDALSMVEEFYAAASRPPLLHVERDSPFHLARGAEGWRVVPGGDSYFQIGAVSRALRACGRARSALEAEVEYADEGPRTVARLGPAVGRAAIDGDWLGLHAVLVDPEHRRQGWGTRLIAALLEWGAERGATTAWLHVETDNRVALATYDRLGFRTHHTMTYLTREQE